MFLSVFLYPELFTGIKKRAFSYSSARIAVTLKCLKINVITTFSICKTTTKNLNNKAQLVLFQFSDLKKPVEVSFTATNLLHWHLDVTFLEDACRARKGYAAQNLSSLRKLAMQIVKRHKDKRSVKKRLFRAAISQEYLKEILIETKI